MSAGSSAIAWPTPIASSPRHLHVERQLLLPLRGQHALVEGARRQHRAQACLQHASGPRADPRARRPGRRRRARARALRRRRRFPTAARPPAAGAPRRRARGAGTRSPTRARVARAVRGRAVQVGCAGSFVVPWCGTVGRPAKCAATRWRGHVGAGDRRDLLKECGTWRRRPRASRPRPVRRACCSPRPPWRTPVAAPLLRRPAARR